MKIRQVRSTFFALIPLLTSGYMATTLSGCAAAAVGAGAAGGIAFTERGAKGDVKGDVSKVKEHAQEALQEMNIQVVGNESQDSGKEQSLSAKSGQTDVTVSMNQATADTTHVEVIARESTFKWNKDYAKEILAKIVNQE